MRSPLLAFSKVDAGPVNTVTETDVLNAPLPTWLEGGEVLSIDAYGDMMNNTGANVTVALAMHLGSTLLFTSNAFALATGTSRRKWMLTGKLYINGRSEQGGGLSFFETSASSQTFPLASSIAAFGVGYGTAAENLGLTKRLRVTATLGTAASTADFLCHVSAVTLHSAHLGVLPVKG